MYCDEDMLSWRVDEKCMRGKNSECLSSTLEWCILVAIWQQCKIMWANLQFKCSSSLEIRSFRQKLDCGVPTTGVLQTSLAVEPGSHGLDCKFLNVSWFARDRTPPCFNCGRTTSLPVPGRHWANIASRWILPQAPRPYLHHPHNTCHLWQPKPNKNLLSFTFFLDMNKLLKTLLPKTKMFSPGDTGLARHTSPQGHTEGAQVACLH